MRLIVPLVRALAIALAALACGFVVHAIFIGTKTPAPTAANAVPFVGTTTPPAVAQQSRTSPAQMPSARPALPASSLATSFAPRAATSAPTAMQTGAVVAAPSVPAPISPAPVQTRPQALAEVPLPGSPARITPPQSVAGATTMASAPAQLQQQTPVVMANPHDPPQILDVSISTQDIHPGDVIVGHVRTSSNVASVEARVEGYSSSLPKVGIGEFQIAYRVPSIPWYLQRTYSLSVIARNIDGAQATRTFPVTLR
ncbi:MAG TPA: hypothetical protein VGD50_06575 [Candidatus Baltobacteraceae bacterium]